MEINQELEKEQNLDYYYNEEEEEEAEGEEQENEEKEEKEQNDNQKNEKEENKENKEKKEEEKNKENKNNIANEKDNTNKIDKENNINNINNENNINNINNENNINNINNENNENKINDVKEEEPKEQTKNQNNQNIESTENSESARQQIIEEIDTTIPKKNIVGENVEKQGDIIIQSFSPNTICHRLIPKGSDLDISQKAHFKCYKIKTKSNIISFITGSKKIVVPYIIFIDENYYYMAKDKIVNQKNPNLRRIGNKYDLLKLSNFQTTKKGDDYEFAFEFVNEDIFDRTFKLLYFTPKEAEDFYAVLHTILGGFNIEIPENLDDDNEEEEEDDEEGEEIEDDGQEEGEAGDDAEGKNQIEVKVDEKEKDEIENNSEEKNNDNNKKIESNEDTKEGTTMSTKEENKETRDVEIIAQ